MRQEKVKVIKSVSTQEPLRNNLNFAKNVIYLNPEQKSNEKKRQEKLKVVRSSLEGRRNSLVDELKVARDVIIENKEASKKEKIRGEKLKVIHSETRRGSLIESIEFAKNTILPKPDTKEKEKKAHEKRLVSTLTVSCTILSFSLPSWCLQVFELKSH